MVALPEIERAGTAIEPMNGPEKGRPREVRGERITLGRSESADIVVKSEGVSRLHAVIAKSEGAWFIQDNNSKNGVLLNGKPVREAWLSDGDIIQIGSSVFRWRDPQGRAGGVENVAFDRPVAESMGGLPMPEPTSFEAVLPKKKPNRRLLLYGGLGLVLAVVMMSQNKKPSTENVGSIDALLAQRDELRTKLDALDGVQSLEAANERASLIREIEKVERALAVKQRDFDSGKAPESVLADKIRKSPVVAIEDPIYKAAEAEMMKLDWSNSALREAEQYFRRGQREYLQGSLQRAIDSFRTALSLHSGHKIAEHYLRRAIYDAEMEAKKQMELGLKYFETLQYQRAMYHFNETVALMAHRPKEKIVSEAERYNALCKRALQAAELFP
jgi:pSer/pThr/pTyr-binding forkhead associated (FHA) protein